jgi:RNA polymerase sigma-70 factor (ECF subfamily)
VANRRRGSGESLLPAASAGIDARVDPAFTHLSDEALVVLTGQGEEAALAALYDRHGRIAYGLAVRVVRDRALAEDVVQEAFMGVWRTAARFSAEQGRASTWLMMLVHRRAVDVVRREERRRGELLDDAPEPAGDSAEDAVWLRLQRERVQAALRRLPDREREVLELAYYGGYTQSELARRLGEPLGTVKSRTSSGLARLRALLETPSDEGSPWSTRPSSS